MSGSLPVANPTVAFWQTSPHKLASHRSSEVVPDECDIAIIGTGLAGVSSAYHLMSKVDGGPKPKIVLFEARQACSGATGRNGGHVKFGMASAKSRIERLGPELANEAIAWVAAQRHALKATVEKENIDCDFFVTRSFDIFFDPVGAKTIKAWLDEQCRTGVFWTQDVQWLDGPNLERITGVKGAVGAVSVPAVSLWPYKFVTSLLARVLDLGALLYTETPVEAIISDQDGSMSLRTSRGITKAKKVIYATNGYSSAVLPQYEGVIVPFKGQASHLVPNDEKHGAVNLTHTYNLYHSINSVDYLVPRLDGSIILGGACRIYRENMDDRNPRWFNTVDDSTLIDDGVKSEFDATMARHFRGWEDSEAGVAETWTGSKLPLMGATPDGFPHVGAVPGAENQWMLAGFNGGGMAFISTTAESIADMVLNGTTFEQTNIPRVFKTTPERLSAKFS